MPFARVIARPLFRLNTSGRDALPVGPFVAAVNHLSHVDAVFTAVAIRQPIRFMAAADLIGMNRGMDFLLPYYGSILVPRSGVALGAVKDSLAHLASGGRLAVFPEGRRSGGWRHTDFKHGAAWLAIRAGVPLVPVALSGTDRVMGLEDRKVRRAHVDVRIGNPILPNSDPIQLTALWAIEMDALLAAGPIKSR